MDELHHTSFNQVGRRDKHRMVISDPRGQPPNPPRLQSGLPSRHIAVFRCSPRRAHSAHLITCGTSPRSLSLILPYAISQLDTGYCTRSAPSRAFRSGIHSLKDALLHLNIIKAHQKDSPHPPAMVRIRAEKVLIGDELIPAAITVKDGLVSAIERDGAAAEGDVVVGSGKVLLPGLIEYAHLLTLRPEPMVPAIHS